MNLNQKEIRWKQRFQNFKSAFMQLEAATALPKLNDLETSGLIQTFEYTFELAWKTLKIIWNPRELIPPLQDKSFKNPLRPILLLMATHGLML
jgi:hypothetical protein